MCNSHKICSFKIGRLFSKYIDLTLLCLHGSIGNASDNLKLLRGDFSKFITYIIITLMNNDKSTTTIANYLNI